MTPGAGDDALVASARFAWEEGARRLDEEGRPSPGRERILTAVDDELRRRVGATFTLLDLARAYEEASSWYLVLAARVAPREPEAWEPAVTLDGAFARYARQAADFR